jgi:hypothetical protein
MDPVPNHKRRYPDRRNSAGSKETTVNSDNDNLEVLKVLCEMRDWLRAGLHGQVGELLERTLDTDKKKRAYQLTDGVLSAKEIGKRLSMGDKTVRQIWDTATRRGLIEVLPAGKRRRRFDLGDFELTPADSGDVSGSGVDNGED